MHKIDFGIRNKVLLGFVVIGLTLLSSGIIAFFEFGRMNRNVSTLISDNIYCVNSSKLLVDMCDQYNSRLFQELSDESLIDIPDLSEDYAFVKLLDEMKQHYTTNEEKMTADSVRYAYAAYMQVVLEVEDVWFEGYSVRRTWYFDRLRIVFEKLRGYIQGLSHYSQTALTGNYDSLNDSYYRSIMPGIVATGAGIILVILFNYFINIYILRPILKMNKGLKNYKEYNKSYDVTFDYGKDQIQEMNSLIKDIVEENKALKK